MGWWLLALVLFIIGAIFMSPWLFVAAGVAGLIGLFAHGLNDLFRSG